MALAPRLDLRQSQTLVMTPQLRQAIQLLQFSNVEVSAFVEQELERNPLLERDERPDIPDTQRAAPDQAGATAAPTDASDASRTDTLPNEAAAPLDADFSNTYDAGGSADGGPLLGRQEGRGGSLSFEDDDRGIDDLANERPPLREYLGEQLRLSFSDPVERMIGAHLIALLCPAGRLTAEPAAIASAMELPLERVEAVRAVMMRFDPVGLFARDLRECLAVQLAEKNRLDPAMATLIEHLDLLGRRDLKRLMALCHVDAEDLAEMIAEIRALDPKPAASYDGEQAPPIVPDLLLRPSAEGGWLVELNPDTMPRLLVNDRYYARVAPAVRREEKAFLSERLASANWLVRSLQQRAQTIVKVAAEIIRQQDAFLQHGVAHLRPLILRDIAAAIEMHESTVSRVTSNKYMATPRGIFELKFFFNAAIQRTSGEDLAAQAVKQRIRKIISEEDPKKPLSDGDIAKLLSNDGIQIARRTVAKYHEGLGIASSADRKRARSR